MPRETLLNTLPAFYRLGTLADMSRMARKLGLARSAIREIRDIEDYLLANKHSLPQEELVNGMRGTQYYALIVAKAIRDAIVYLEGIKKNIESYQESVHDVVD